MPGLSKNGTLMSCSYALTSSKRDFSVNPARAVRKHTMPQASRTFLAALLCIGCIVLLTTVPVSVPTVEEETSSAQPVLPIVQESAPARQREQPAKKPSKPAPVFDASAVTDELEEIFFEAEAAVTLINVTSDEALLQWNGDIGFHPASTYKLFIADSMIRAVEQGQWAWEDWFLGTSLGECFDAMIIYSDNDCPEAWLDEIPPDALTQRAAEIGATHTQLDWGVFSSTTNDMAVFLAQAYRGELFGSDGRTRLFEDMVSQEFRDGIPAGVPAGTVVADKVGFLEAELHDVGIIELPSGSFALAIYTEGSSWESIAEATSVIVSELK